MGGGGWGVPAQGSPPSGGGRVGGGGGSGGPAGEIPPRWGVGTYRTDRYSCREWRAGWKSRSAVLCPLGAGGGGGGQNCFWGSFGRSSGRSRVQRSGRQYSVAEPKGVAGAGTGWAAVANTEARTQHR